MFFLLVLHKKDFKRYVRISISYLVTYFIFRGSVSERVLYGKMAFKKRQEV